MSCWPKVTAATSVSVDCCAHGKVWIELKDAAGVCFAVAAFDSAEALRIAMGMRDAVDHVLARDRARRVN